MHTVYKFDNINPSYMLHNFLTLMYYVIGQCLVIVFLYVNKLDTDKKVYPINIELIYLLIWFITSVCSIVLYLYIATHNKYAMYATFIIVLLISPAISYITIYKFLKIKRNLYILKLLMAKFILFLFSIVFKKYKNVFDMDIFFLMNPGN